jgi:hypothetical protein
LPDSGQLIDWLKGLYQELIYSANDQTTFNCVGSFGDVGLPPTKRFHRRAIEGFVGVIFINRAGLCEIGLLCREL